jgi:hypothetical protein
MNKEEVIKELLKDFRTNVETSLWYNKDEIEVSFIFKKKHSLVRKNNTCNRRIIMETRIGKIVGYLGSYVTYNFVFKRNKIKLQCDFSLAKIHDIGTIEEAVYYNTKKALETFLEEV